MNIIEISPAKLEDYASISMAFEVREILAVDLVDSGLGGMAFSPRPVSPYIKDYDTLGNPLTWPDEFDIANWGLFLAVEGQSTLLGGAAVAWNTNGVNMLEGRRDLAVLWDIRVAPQSRGKGIGRELFVHAAGWARARGCTQMKIETQDINLPACRFYAAMGCQLGDVRRFAYAQDARVAHEVQLNWYLGL